MLKSFLKRFLATVRNAVLCIGLVSQLVRKEEVGTATSVIEQLHVTNLPKEIRNALLHFRKV